MLSHFLDGSCIPESPSTSSNGTVTASPAYLYIIQMERTLRVSLYTCPLQKILKNQKDLILKVVKLPPINTTHLGKPKRATCHIWFPHSPSFRFLCSLPLTLFFSLILFFSETLNSSLIFFPLLYWKVVLPKNTITHLQKWRLLLKFEMVMTIFFSLYIVLYPTLFHFCSIFLCSFSMDQVMLYIFLFVSFHIYVLFLGFCD